MEKQYIITETEARLLRRIIANAKRNNKERMDDMFMIGNPEEYNKALHTAEEVLQ